VWEAWSSLSGEDERWEVSLKGFLGDPAFLMGENNMRLNRTLLF